LTVLTHTLSDITRWLRRVCTRS